MSTATAPTTAARPDGDRATRHRAPSSAVLTRVELRKMVDTRAGRWLLVAAALVCVAVAIARALTGDATDRTFGAAFQLTLVPAGIILPVLGILAATGEWSQRTALTTFALVPRRGRIVAAKAQAVLLLGLAGVVLGLAAAAVSAVLAGAVGNAPDAWSVGGGDLAQGVLFQELSVVWGLAFGLLLFVPAQAIVAYFVVPTALALVGGFSNGLGDAMEWIEPNNAFSSLSDGSAAGSDWGKIAVAGLLWIALPLAVGTVRTMRREVK